MVKQASLNLGLTSGFGLRFLLSPQGAAKDSVVPELGLWVPGDPLIW